MSKASSIFIINDEI